MNRDLIMSNPGQLTMSSREIAELVESRHDNVRVTIERLVARRVIALPAMQEKATAGRPAKEYVFSGEQGKRDSIIVVAQLCPEFTARLVDRWQELESRHDVTVPQTLPEALRLAADLAEQNSTLRLVVQEQAPKVEALQRIAQARGTLCLTDAAKHLGVQRKVLLAWMRENRWIYRREGAAHWLGYQPRLQAGLLEHRVTVLGTEDDGAQRLASQVRVTPKGLTVLAQKVGGIN
ncbi:phage antirepressor KilAC domain-containing protein [Halopseudomonas bauzanensis]|uniref:phage antirepressor KilAC domain-containing protein n=1 Tax=Halopseudomonas bauzanensis TaxID=653930 RepID=UPI002554D637|nr:phage antirepressor KilAC domain-containing protein [Halopseudomonas bauzanensis]